MAIGGGKAGGSQSDPAATTLAALGQAFATETQGLRQGLISQFSNILTNPSGKGGFDQAGYDAAMEKYKTDLANYNANAGQTAPAAPGSQFAGSPGDLGYNSPAQIAARSSQATSTAPPVAPTKEQFQRGGGIQVPIISQALEAVRRASSQSQQGTQEELARTGLTGTPFGQNILATGKREGNLAAANTQTDIMKSLYNLIPNFVLGQSQTALSGLSGAVGGNVSGTGKSSGFGVSVPKGG